MWRIASNAVALGTVVNAPLASETEAATLGQVVVVAPLPSGWTMMLIGLALGFAAYRLFSI